MNTFILDKDRSHKKFTFSSSTSSNRLSRVSISTDSNSNLDWIALVSKLKLKVTLRYIVSQTKEFIDDRIEEFPIHLQIELNQKQPVFNLNKTISTKTFLIGCSDKEHFYSDLIIDLEIVENTKENFSLLFEYEMSEMEEENTSNKT